MQDIKNVLAKINQAGLPTNKQEFVVDDFAKGVIDKVFDQLAVIFPAWKHAWPTQKELSAAKMEWTKAFTENGICTIEQIQYGFKKARQAETDFLPSCGKFISWCEPSASDLGYPSEDSALKECMKYRNELKMGMNPVARPFIIELCNRVDWWLMTNASTNEQIKRSQKHFKDTYIEMIQTYVEPEVIEAPRLPTREMVDSGMSLQQKEDAKKRGEQVISDVRKKLKKAKYL